MDREKQEPTFGDADLSELRFRPNRAYQPRGLQHHNEFWLRFGICLAIVVVVAIGLIEWNARRQAAAMTAELMRPMTAAEQAQLDKQMRERDARVRAETATELAQARREIWGESTQPATPPAPLNANERCIQGRRFKRLENGWQQLKPPC